MRGENKEVKRHFGFDYTELTAIAEYLESQEEKGLRLKEFEGKSFVFEKAEPRKIRYSVEIYTADYLQKDFIASCEEDGWEYVDVYNKELHIFRTQQEDAVEIMTDDKEKMKIVSKRALLKPGNLFLFFFPLLQLMRFLMNYDGMNAVFIEIYESNPYYYLYFSLLILAFFFPLFILTDYFLWFFKARLSIKKDKAVGYINLKKADRKRKIRYYAFALLGVCVMGFNSFIDSGYAVNIIKLDDGMEFSGTAYWFLFYIILAVAFFMSDSAVPKRITQSKKKLISFLIVSLCSLALTLGFVAHNEKKAEKININGTPITFSDFGYEDIWQRDSSIIRATRFAQQYRCNIRAMEELPDENFDTALFYEVFVCDSPELRDEYIEKVLEEHDRIRTEATVMSYPETKWDKYYKVDSDGNEFYAMAIKDDTVIHTVLPIHTNGQDFFEVAYEKLFGEAEQTIVNSGVAE